MTYDCFSESFVTYLTKKQEKGLTVNEKKCKYLIDFFLMICKSDIFKPLLLIKKSDLIQKDNYESINEYNNEVLKIAEKIKIIFTTDNGIENKWVIETTTDDIRKWQDFLKLMEKNTNLEIQNFLIKNFNLLVESQEEKREYFISDIDETIKFAKNDFKNATRLLQSIKKVLIVSKDIERLKKAFITTPLINQSEFYAARILDSTSVIII